MASAAHGGMLSFNMNDGFCDAVVRGMRSGFLAEDEYHHLVRCETIEDVKLNLQETDYGNFLQNETSPIPPSVVERRCQAKWVTEFKYLHANSVEPLTTFLNFISYEYMIDNVLMILKATMDHPEVDPKVFLERAHPLGMFEASALKAIGAFEASARGYEELYSTVLIKTPVGKYFQQYLQDQAARQTIQGGADVRNILDEVPVATLRNMVMKLYLEDFYHHCKAMGGATAEVMGKLLEARCDFITINVTLNSIGTSYNEANQRASSRRALFPAVGRLYPIGIDMLDQVDNEDKLGRVLEKYSDYKPLWEAAPVDEDGHKQITNTLYEYTTEQLELAFEGQFHYGVFYAYVKLKEQETKNIVFFCDCIEQGHTPELGDIIPVFSKHSKWRTR